MPSAACGGSRWNKKNGRRGGGKEKCCCEDEINWIDQVNGASAVCAAYECRECRL